MSTSTRNRLSWASPCLLVALSGACSSESTTGSTNHDQPSGSGQGAASATRPLLRRSSRSFAAMNRAATAWPGFLVSVPRV